MTDNPASDERRKSGMKPQALNAEQKRQLTLVKATLRRYQAYQAGVADNAAVSSELTEQISRAVDIGITRYRLAQELGMTHQAVDSRLERRTKKQQTTRN